MYQTGLYLREESEMILCAIEKRTTPSHSPVNIVTT